MSLRGPPVFPWDYSHAPTCPAFYLGAGNWTRVLTLALQALYPLSTLRSSKKIFFFIFLSQSCWGLPTRQALLKSVCIYEFIICILHRGKSDTQSIWVACLGFPIQCSRAEMKSQVFQLLKYALQDSEALSLALCPDITHLNLLSFFSKWGS